MHKLLLILLFSTICIINVVTGQNPGVPASGLKADLIGRKFLNLSWKRSQPEATSFSIIIDGKSVRSSIKTNETLLLPLQPCIDYNVVVRSHGTGSAFTDSTPIQISTKSAGGPVNAVLGYSSDDGKDLYVTVIDEQVKRMCNRVKYLFSLNGQKEEESLDDMKAYTGLTTGQSYEVSVVAMEIATGVKSQPVSVTTMLASSTTTTTTTPPPFSSFPRNLTVSEITETSYKVSWNAIIPTPAKLQIFDGNTAIDLAVTATERVFTDRKRCSKYESKLIATAADSRKTETPVVSINTASPALVPIGDIITFTTDSDLLVTLCDDYSIRTCYDIEYIFQLNNGARINTTRRFMEFSNLDKTGEYVVNVIVRDTKSGLESPVKASEMTKITTTTTPRPFKSEKIEVTVDSNLGYSASISWTPTDPPAISYNIHVENNKVGSTTKTNFRVFNLSPCSPNNIKVEAISRDGRSMFSDVKVITGIEKEGENINDVVLFGNPDAKELYVTVIDEDKKRACNRIEYVYKLNKNESESSLDKFKVFSALTPGTEYTVTVIGKEQNTGKLYEPIVKKITLA